MTRKSEMNPRARAAAVQRAAIPWSRRARPTFLLAVLASLVAVLGGGPPAFGKGLEGASLLVADERAKKVFGYDADGHLVGSLDLSSANGHPTSVSVDGNSVYVLDGNKKRVYRYDMAGSLEGVSAELRRADGGSLSVPTGMAIDGGELWVVDRGVARLSRYALAEAFSTDRRVSAHQDIPLSPDNARAEGLAIDDVWLYVLDRKSVV